MIAVLALGPLLRFADIARSRPPALTLDLDRYHIEVPLQYMPEAGMPGDPRRSKYVFMVLPLSLLKLPPSPWLVAHPRIGGIVPSLHLDPSDVVRLKNYHLMSAAALGSYGGYSIWPMSNGNLLYIAQHAQKPLYFSCPFQANKDREQPSAFCYTEETLIAGAPGRPDLTVQYAFLWNEWPVLPQLSAGLKSSLPKLVSIKN